MHLWCIDPVFKTLLKYMLRYLLDFSSIAILVSFWWIKKMFESYLKELPPNTLFYVRILKSNSEKAALKTAPVTNYIPRKINIFIT